MTRTVYLGLLGADATARTQINLINRVLFRHLVDRLQASSDAPRDATRRTWLVVDETKEAGALDALPVALSFGRSKGICTVLGVQDQPGLQRVYGKESASEIAELTRHVAMFAATAESARWGVELFGTYETSERTVSASLALFGGGKTENESIATREVVTAAEFGSLPDPKHSHGVHGYFRSPLVPAWRAVIPWSYVEQVRPCRLAGFPTMEESRITQDRMTLSSWSEEERQTLGISSVEFLPPKSQNVISITERIAKDTEGMKRFSRG